MGLIKALFSLVFDLWMFFWGTKLALGKLRSCASMLGFTPGGFGEKWENWTIVECHDGKMDGLSAAIALAIREEEMTGTKVKVTCLLVRVQTPALPTFKYEMLPATWGASRNFSHPDAAFNKECAIKSDNGAKLVSLLDNPGLRSLIVTFLKESPQSCLNQYSGWTEIRHVLFSKPEDVITHVRRTARVVKGLYDRADRLGFFNKPNNQQKAA